MKKVVGLNPDLARKFTFSAATLIQNEPTTADGWSAIVDDLEKALKYANLTADELARQEEE